MLVWVALVLALIVQGSCVLFALSLDSELNRTLQLLRQGIEVRTRSEAVGAPTGNDRPNIAAATSLTREGLLIEECLDDIFSSSERRVVVLSLNELLSLAKMGIERSRMALKSLPKLGLLAGGAGAIFVLAAGAFEPASWAYAAASGFAAMVSSLVSRIVSKRAGRRAHFFAELVQKLPRD